MMILQSLLLPWHTTSTNTWHIFTHGHLHLSTQKDDVLPCCLPFINSKILVGNNY